MLVRDRMSAHPVTISSDADYKGALRLMHEHSLHHLPVLDGGKQLVGIVAERDLLLAALHHLQSMIEVGEVMHHDVVTVTPDTPITDAAVLMVEHRIGGLPVLDGHHNVVGIITESDIFRAFVAMQSAQEIATATRSAS
jgi:acetoin utilization protein AcuB